MKFTRRATLRLGAAALLGATGCAHRDRPVSLRAYGVSCDEWVDRREQHGPPIWIPKPREPYDFRVSFYQPLSPYTSAYILWVHGQQGAWRAESVHLRCDESRARAPARLYRHTEFSQSAGLNRVLDALLRSPELGIVERSEVPKTLRERARALAANDPLYRWTRRYFAFRFPSGVVRTMEFNAPLSELARTGQDARAEPVAAAYTRLLRRMKEFSYMIVR